MARTARHDGFSAFRIARRIQALLIFFSHAFMLCENRNMTTEPETMKRIGLMFATLCVSAAAASAQTSMIEPGEIGRVEAHGVCRMVDNQNGARMMVPHSMVTEWASGGSAFLAQSPVNTNISLCPCTWNNVNHQVIPVIGQDPQNYYRAPTPFNKGESAFFALYGGSPISTKVAHLSNGVIDFASQPLLFPQNPDHSVQEASVDGEYVATVLNGSFYLHGDLTVYIQRRNGSGYNTVHTLHQNSSHQMSNIVHASSDFSTIVHFPGRWGDVRVYERQSNGSYTRVADISTGFINQSNFRYMRAYIDEDSGKIHIHQYWWRNTGAISSDVFNELFTLQRTGNTYQHVDTRSLAFENLILTPSLMGTMPRHISNDGSKFAGYGAEFLLGDQSVGVRDIDGARTAHLRILHRTSNLGWASRANLHWINNEEFVGVYSPLDDASADTVRAANPNHSSLPAGQDTLGWVEFYRVTDTPGEFSIERVKTVYLEAPQAPMAMSTSSEISNDGSAIAVTFGFGNTTASRTFRSWILKTLSDC